MVGETPNIDRIAREGAIFMDYVAMQSCTSGRNAFVTGMYPLRTGMIPPQLPGSPSYLRPGTPCIAKFLLDLGYTTGQFGKNHLGDHPDALPTAHGFQEYWGYLYHLDAMQQVSFPDINKTPTEQGIAPPMKVAPIPGIPEPPGAIDPKDGVCMAAPRPVLWMKSSDGTAKNQMGKDEGPLTLERSKTIDEEISAHVIDWLDRNDPKKTDKPFFCYYNPARMHVTTVLSHKVPGHAGREGRQGLGHQRSRHEADGRQHRPRPQEAGRHGRARQHHRRLHHRQRRRDGQLPRRWHHPVQGSEGPGLGRRLPRPCVVRWPGHIKPGTVKNQLFAALDWLPTLVEIAGGPKGNELKKQIEKGALSRHRQDHARRRQSTRLPHRQVGKVGARLLLLLLGRDAVRGALQELEVLLLHGEGGAAGWIEPLTNYHWTMIQNIKRDPFEQAVGLDGQKTALGLGGALAAPSTAYIYDWNILPIGQLLWTKELMSYKKFPPLQAPETYNLEGILREDAEVEPPERLTP